jgi:hypothetical protein
MKGQIFESPRGPVLIDAQTRDVVHDMYIRKVEKVGRPALEPGVRHDQGREGPGQEQVTLPEAPPCVACPTPTPVARQSRFPVTLSLGVQTPLHAHDADPFDGIAYGMLLFVLSWAWP